MQLDNSRLLTLRQNRPIIVVVLDSRRAALHRYHDGQLERLKTVHARLSGQAKMIEALLRQLISLADREGGVIVGGTPEAAAAAVAVIGPTFPGRVLLAGDLQLRATDAEIIKAAEQGATTLRHAREEVAVTRLLELAGSRRRAVVGAEETLAALARHEGRELLLTQEFLAANPGVADAAVEQALDQHATIEVVSGPAAARLDAAGGIGLLLRVVAH